MCRESVPETREERTKRSSSIEIVRTMEQAGQSSSNSLETRMAERPAPAASTEPAVACVISWAGSDSSVYEPDKVCIGPFHRPKQPHPSESMKEDALYRFLPCGDQRLRRQELTRYVEAMGRIEDRVRRCYSQPFGDITSEEFKRMLLVDGCFLHTRFVPSRAATDPVDDDIMVDRDIVFLLVNQLPFFVMEEIHKLITPTPDATAAATAGVKNDATAAAAAAVEETHKPITSTPDATAAAVENDDVAIVVEETHKPITSTPDATAASAAVKNDDVAIAVKNDDVATSTPDATAAAAAAKNDDVAIVIADNVIKRVEALVRRSDYSAATVARPLAPPPGHLLDLLHRYFKPTAEPPSPATGMHAANGNGAADGNGTSGQEPSPVHQPFWRAVTSYYADGLTFIKQKVGRAPAARTRTSAPGWSSATYYYAAGVRFMPRKVGTGAGDARSILDVELRGSTLHVPCLKVDGNTFRMLRNMVALEQSSTGKLTLSRSHVASYCFFLSQLAGTKEDVELLVAKKIIVTLLPDAAVVATGLSELFLGTIRDPDEQDRSYLWPQQEALEKLCEDGWMKSMAWLRHHKCSNYFMALAVVATIVIVLCTIEQSVFAALSYATPKGRRN